MRCVQAWWRERHERQMAALVIPRWQKIADRERSGVQVRQGKNGTIEFSRSVGVPAWKVWKLMKDDFYAELDDLAKAGVKAVGK